MRRRIIRINKPKKIRLKINDKKENKEIIIFNKLIEKFYKSITKKNKPDDYEKFQIDIFEIIDSKYSTYSLIKKILNIIENRFIIKNFIGIKFRKLQDDHYDDLFGQQDNLNEEEKYNEKDDKFKLLCIEANKIFVDFIINLIDKIYKKFNKIEETFVLDLFTYYTIDIERILIHLKSHKFTFNNIKIIKKLHYLSEVDYFDLLDNYDIKYILTSNHIISNFTNIDNIIQKYFPKLDYNKIFLILIDNLIENNRLINFNINNVGEWILSKNKSLDTNSKIKLYTLYIINSIINFIDGIDLMNNDEYTQNIINYRPNINIINYFLKKNFIKKEFTLQQLIEADQLIINMLFKSINLRKKISIKNKTKYGFKNIKIDDYDYFLKYNNIAVYTGFNMINIDIFISFINKNRILFINSLINYVKKVTNVNDIINCKLFHNKNNIFTLDEKVNILKKIYSGKITASNLELFILNNNELACYFIKNIPINKKYIKYALSVSNLKFIETLCDLKYIFTTNDLLYITSDLYLEEILIIINKYNTIDFLTNLDWYYHIKYILNIDNNNLDIVKIIYNDDNQYLRDLFNKKINDIKYDYNFDDLNNLNFNDFCINVVKNNIKITKYDIYKVKCLQKRLFLLNYEK